MIPCSEKNNFKKPNLYCSSAHPEGQNLPVLAFLFYLAMMILIIAMPGKHASISYH